MLICASYCAVFFQAKTRFQYVGVINNTARNRGAYSRYTVSWTIIYTTCHLPVTQPKPTAQPYYFKSSWVEHLLHIQTQTLTCSRSHTPGNLGGYLTPGSACHEWCELGQLTWPSKPHILRKADKNLLGFGEMAQKVKIPKFHPQHPCCRRRTNFSKMSSILTQACTYQIDIKINKNTPCRIFVYVNGWSWRGGFNNYEHLLLL